MPADVLKLVESVLAEKTAAATKERELISNLNRVLPDIGYRVVPIAAQAHKTGGAARPIRRPGKPLPCPQCPRTFGHPLHLGRHMSATHGAKLGDSNGAKPTAAHAAKRAGSHGAKRGATNGAKPTAAHGAKRARRAATKARARRKRS